MNRETSAARRAVLSPLLRARNRKRIDVQAGLGLAFPGLQRAASAIGAFIEFVEYVGDKTASLLSQCNCSIRGYVCPVLYPGTGENSVAGTMTNRVGFGII